MSVAEAENAIRVKVLLFSVLREGVGLSTFTVDVPFGSSGGTMLDQLASEYPTLDRYREHIRLAVNASYVTQDVVLHNDDEVALITPTSGG